MQPAIPLPSSLQSHTDLGGVSDYHTSTYNTAPVPGAPAHYSPPAHYPPPTHYHPTLLDPHNTDDSSLMDSSQHEYYTEFHPYSPQEVKHRKRTTANQLKVLERIFANDTTKPNSTLRARLATQLDMTPRSVQVWFQNRRAKAKMLAGRDKVSGKTAAVAAAAAAASGTTDKRTPDLRVDSHQTASPIITHRPPPGPPPPALRVDTASIESSSPPSSWAGSPPLASLASNDSSTYLSLPEHSHHNLRRGSLPTNVFSHEDHMDLYARRGSVDASLHRMANGPYAGSALARNVFHNNLRQSRSNLGASPSSPYVAHQLTRHASMDAFMMPSNPRGQLGRQMQAPLRPVYEPVPGPLPSDTFTFGAASSDLSPPSLAAASPESEEDGASYDASSRFGSWASFASSSSYVSDCGQSESSYQSPPGLDNGLYTPSSASVSSASASAPNIHTTVSGNEMASYGLDGAPPYNRSHSMPVPYGHAGPAHDVVQGSSDNSLSTQYYASSDAVHHSYAQPMMASGFASSDAGASMHGELAYPSEYGQEQRYESGDYGHDALHAQHPQGHHGNNVENFAGYQTTGQTGGQALYAYT